MLQKKEQETTEPKLNGGGQALKSAAAGPLKKNRVSS